MLGYVLSEHFFCSNFNLMTAIESSVFNNNIFLNYDATFLIHSHLV